MLGMGDQGIGELTVQLGASVNIGRIGGEHHLSSFISDLDQLIVDGLKIEIRHVGQQIHNEQKITVENYPAYASSSPKKFSRRAIVI